MVERFRPPLRTAAEPDDATETVVHDPQGRPWLVCTSYADGTAYETQVYYTARAGVRGFPTGHGERFGGRAEAVAGHRWWCLRVRHGEVYPDLPPDSSY